MPELFRIGLDGIAVDSRQDPEVCREMTEIYLEAIELTKAGGSSQEGLLSLKERIRHMALGGITYGTSSKD